MYSGVGLRPLSSVQCYRCGLYGHYANDPGCSYARIASMHHPIRPAIMAVSAPSPSASSVAVPVPSSLSVSSHSLLDASLVQFRDGVTVFDAIKNLMADNIAMRKELQELRTKISSMIAKPSSSVDSSTSSIPLSASVSTVVNDPPRFPLSSSAAVSSLSSTNHNIDRPSLDDLLDGMLINDDANVVSDDERKSSTINDLIRSPNILGPVGSNKKKNNKKKKKKKL